MVGGADETILLVVSNDVRPELKQGLVIAPDD